MVPTTPISLVENFFMWNTDFHLQDYDIIIDVTREERREK